MTGPSATEITVKYRTPEDFISFMEALTAVFAGATVQIFADHVDVLIYQTPRPGVRQYISIPNHMRSALSSTIAAFGARTKSDHEIPTAHQRLVFSASTDVSMRERLAAKITLNEIVASVTGNTGALEFP